MGEGPATGADLLVRAVDVWFSTSTKTKTPTLEATCVARASGVGGCCFSLWWSE